MIYIYISEDLYFSYKLNNIELINRIHIFRLHFTLFDEYPEYFSSENTKLIFRKLFILFKYKDTDTDKLRKFIKNNFKHHTT